MSGSENVIFRAILSMKLMNVVQYFKRNVKIQLGSLIKFT